MTQLLLVLLFGLFLVAPPGRGNDMQSLYNARCGSCHDGSVPKAPHQVKFQLIGADAIYASLTTGLMQPNATGIDDKTLRALADFLG
ncbi:MAG: cytochrome c, partial [Gammaproteobacteria bacterium]|nr:cytochrome c [Gammaproteobacteria bacterium]